MSGFIIPLPLYTCYTILTSGKVSTTLIVRTNGRSFTEHTRIRAKVKKNGLKEFITIRKIVYIGDRKSESYRTPSGKTIEYSHRFEIRGHWRTLMYGKVGKDRSGNYCVKEKTWVRPHEKGEKDAPPIKKTRVLLSDSIESEVNES